MGGSLCYGNLKGGWEAECKLDIGLKDHFCLEASDC